MSTPRTYNRPPFATKQFDHSEAERIGPFGGTSREYAMGPVIAGWRAQQLESLRTIESPDDKQMREALDVSKTRLEHRQNLKHAVGLMFDAKTFRDFSGILIRAAHKSDGLRNKHG
jgi:hypothetical protein